MSDCGDLLGRGIATVSTSSGNRTCGGASRINSYSVVRVSDSRNLVSNVGIAASAGVGGITCSSASRSGYNRLIAVTKSGGLVSDVRITASTGVGGITCSSASRSGYNSIVVMDVCGSKHEFAVNLGSDKRKLLALYVLKYGLGSVSVYNGKSCVSIVKLAELEGIFVLICL